MDTTVERLENCRAAITIGFDADEIKKAMRAKARQISRRQQIPGFRPGRAPYQIIERFVGRATLLQDVIEELTPKSLSDALEENDLDIYDYDSMESEIVDEDPLTLRFVFQTPPRVDLGDYGNIRVDEEDVSVEEAEIELILKEFQETTGTWTTSLGPAEYGDLITIDIRSDLLDGTNLSDSKGTQGVLFEPDEDDPIRGSENLLGMMVNTVKEFHITYPEDYATETLAGRMALYKVTLLDLKKRALPDMTDDWVQEISPFESLTQLRQEIEEELLAVATDEMQEKLLRDYLRAVNEQAQVEVPAKMVEERIDRILAALELELAQKEISLEEFLEDMEFDDLDAVREDMRPRAEEAVIENVILFTISEAEGISVDDEEVDAEIERMVERFGEHEEETREILASRRDDLSGRILARKASEYAIRLAKGEIPQAEPAEELPETDETVVAADDEDSASADSATGDTATESEEDKKA